VSPEIALCLLAWPDEDPETGVSRMDHAYNVFLLLSVYALPVCGVTACAIHLRRLLWSHPPHTCSLSPEAAEKVMASRRKKQRTVKTLALLLAYFALCWLPYHMYYLCKYYSPEVSSWSSFQHIYLLTFWLAMSHAFVYPFIYLLMNPS